ncbi:MAG: diguanylate cyclase [Acidimicrobiia bacterium]
MNRRRQPLHPDERSEFGILVGLQLCAVVFGVLFATTAHGSDATPATGLSGAAAVLVLGALTWFVGPRIGADAFAVALALTAALIAGAATQAADAQGQIAAGLVLVMLGVLTAFFVPGRRMWLVLAVEMMSFGVALLLNPKLSSPLPFVALCGVVGGQGYAVARVARGLRAEAEHDPLTGVLNRHGFEDQAYLLESLARRAGRAVIVGYVDLDGFKHYNDVNGHGAGDQLLADLAAAWTGALRSGDLLVRWGGDEFVVLLVAPDEDTAEVVIDRMRGAYPAQWSVGLAAWSNGEDLYTAISRADDALLAAKGQGAPGAHAHSTRGPWPDKWSEPARMRAALASMLDPHLLLEPIRSSNGAVVDFVIVDANDAACDFTTMSREDLIGSCILDLTHCKPSAWIMERYAHAFDTGEAMVLDGLRYQNEVLGPEIRQLDVRAVRFSDALSVSWRDVTERLSLDRRSGE